MHTSIMQTDTGSLFVAKCKSRKEAAGLSVTNYPEGKT